VRVGGLRGAIGRRRLGGNIVSRLPYIGGGVQREEGGMKELLHDLLVFIKPKQGNIPQKLPRTTSHALTPPSG
jgi:hypothetical protein